MKCYLGDVCHFYSGTGFPVEYQGKTSGELPFYKVGDISNNTIAGNTRLSMCSNYISWQEANELKGSILPSDTVVFAKIGEALKLNRRAITKCDCLVDNNVMGIAPNPEVLRIDYFFYFMKRLKMQDLAESTTVPSVRKSKLERVEITVPSMAEQIEIEWKLQAIDCIIQKRKQQLSALDDLIKARFVEMFGDNESNSKGWKQSRIGDCCTLKSGTSLPAEVENEGGPIPYVKVGDMNYPGNERYITTSSRYVSSTAAGNGLFAVGSILFPKRGGAIGTNKKRMTKLPICADLNIMGVSSNGALLPEYLLTYFDMIDLGALSDGSSVPQINNKNIAPLLICLPPLELQREFASFVYQIDKSKSAIQKSLDETQILFDSLMQKYFG